MVLIVNNSMVEGLYMREKIGIPRGMLYYENYPMWEEYFTSLNYEVVSSPKTNKEILNMGIASCVDEACLPIKIFHGHVEYLKDKVDYIFIPQIIKLYKKEYCCPKILGLTDMIKHSIEDLPNIIDTKFVYNSKDGFKNAYRRIGKHLKVDSNSRSKAYRRSIEVEDGHKRWLYSNTFKTNGLVHNSNDNLNILVIGHSYNIYDEYMNLGIIRKLEAENINIFVPEDVSEEDKRQYTDSLSKRMFWTHGINIVGSAFSLIDKKAIQGIIYLSSFGCGMDSVLVYLTEKRAQANNIPFMTITLDEQTGEGGFNTRLEAFLDMIKWRRRDENNISSLW